MLLGIGPFGWIYISLIVALVLVYLASPRVHVVHTDDDDD